MAGSNIGMNFVRGFQVGQDIGEKWNERDAGAAMGELAAYDPMQAQAAEVGYDPMQAQAEEQVEGGGFGQQQDGQPKLPSTRDWFTLRTNAIQAASRLGPDAVAEAMDQIDAIQRKGALDNLYIAKELVTQGRASDAGRYLEAANSYQGNFAAMHTSPARLQDGSTQLAFEVIDEQTGQPMIPGMVATPEVIDRMILMAENPSKYGSIAHDRQLAEEKYQRDIYESDRGYNRDIYESDRGYNYDVAKTEFAGRPKPQTYESKDYDEAIKTRLSWLPVNPETGTPGVTPQQMQQIQTFMSQARADPTLRNADPGLLADRIFTKVMGVQADG